MKNDVVHCDVGLCGVPSIFNVLAGLCIQHQLWFKWEPLCSAHTMRPHCEGQQQMPRIRNTVTRNREVEASSSKSEDIRCRGPRTWTSCGTVRTARALCRHSPKMQPSTPVAGLVLCAVRSSTWQMERCAEIAAWAQTHG